MKWFVSTNEKSLYEKEFFRLLKVAVYSAQKNTSLEPYLIYEGNYNEKLKSIEKQGVKIIEHELPIRNEIKSYVKKAFADSSSELVEKMINVRTGGFLRSEIPVVIKEEGFSDDKVLYTDCDVVFLDNLNLDEYSPNFFAAYGWKEGGYTKFNIGGYMHFNSGVMLMNVDSMYKSYDNFVNFVLSNGYDKERPSQSKFWQKNLLLSDQVSYNLFYEDKIDRLPKEYNWNPSKGVNQNAKIVHFNGLKWTQWEKYLNGEVRPALKEQVKRDEKSYKHYVGVAKKYEYNN